jgi:hypothetical protein
MESIRQLQTNNIHVKSPLNVGFICNRSFLALPPCGILATDFSLQFRQKLKLNLKIVRERTSKRNRAISNFRVNGKLKFDYQYS